jgi:hypothetical protein
MSTKTTKPANEPKPTSKQRKPEVWLCACVCSDAPEQHAWTNLTQGFVSIVSVEDADLLAAHRWTVALNRRRGTPYVRRAITDESGKPHPLYLHKAITGVVGSAQVDHKNGVGLDNRRSNLRPATRGQNMANQRSRRRRSPHIPEGITLPKGVTYLPACKKRPFRAEVGGTHIGCFTTAEEAARAFDKRAYELWGEFAFLNYPDEPMLAAAE